jgi:hypothetical protein
MPAGAHQAREWNCTKKGTSMRFVVAQNRALSCAAVSVEPIQSN